MTQCQQLDLSAVIAVGNLKNDIENIVKNVAACQEYGIEIILVLDNQPADLQEELNFLLLECRSKNVVVTEGNWGNPGSPRNVGLALSSRKYVAFWDSDDIPNLMGVMKSLMDLSQTSADALVGRFSIRSDNLQKFERPFKTSYIMTSMAQRIISNPGLWRFIFKKESIKSIAVPPYSSAEDQLFLQRFFANPRTIVESNEHVYTYAQGGKSQLTKSSKVAEQTIQVLNLGLHEGMIHPTEYQSLCDCLAIKQILTIVKHGNSREVLRGLSAVILFLQKAGIRRVAIAGLNFLYVKGRCLSNRKLKVKVLLMGGLGNQLFQVAYGMYLSKTQGAEVKLLDLSRNVRRTTDGLPEVMLYKGLHTSEFSERRRLEAMLDRGFGYLLRQKLNPRKFSTSTRKIARLALAVLSYLKWKSVDSLFVPDNIGWVDWEPENRSYIAIGYFQSYVYVMNPGVLSSLNELTLESDEEEVERFRNLAEEEHPLLVHIRLGDYRKEPSFGILPSSYYQTAIVSQMKNEAYGSIWVFSDESINLDEYIPLQYLGLVRVIESVGSSSVALLEVMRLCRGYVIANSTLSWWAASLSNYENARVYYPEPWFSNLATPRSLIPPNWIAVARNQ